MQKLFISFLVVVFTTSLVMLNWSCGDENGTQEDPFLTVSPGNGDIIFSSKGDTIKPAAGGGLPITVFKVKTNQGKWDVVVTKEDWVSVEYKTDSTFTLKAKEVAGVTPPPTAEITVSAGTAQPHIIKAMQKPKGSFLFVTPADMKTIIFSKDGGETAKSPEGVAFTAFSVTIAEGDTWECELNAEAASWLEKKVTESKTGGEIRLSAQPNTSRNNRTAKLTVKLTSTNHSIAPVEITVVQEAVPSDFEVTPNPEQAVVIKADGTPVVAGMLVYTVHSTHPDPWKVESSDESWLTIDKTETGFTLVVKPNVFADPCFATVTVTSGPNEKKIEVIQEGNIAGTPKAAVSDETWVIEDANQVWSDYIAYGEDKTTFVAYKVYDIVGDYRNNPGYRGYVYNFPYVVEYQAKLCPSPWRVPSPRDIIDMDLGLGNPGYNVSYWGKLGSKKDVNASEYVAKYVEMGFEFSGRFNPNTNIFEYRPTSGYMLTNAPATEESVQGNSYWGDKPSHFCITQDALEFGGDGLNFGVFLQNEANSSLTKAFGLPVRCVKDLK